MKLLIIKKMISQWTCQSFISKPIWLLTILKKYKKSKTWIIMPTMLSIKRPNNNSMEISSKEITNEKNLSIWYTKKFKQRLHIKLRTIKKSKMKKLIDKNKSELSRETQLISCIVEIFTYFWLLLLKRPCKEESKSKLPMPLGIYWWENYWICWNGLKQAWITRKNSQAFNAGNNS